MFITRSDILPFLAGTVTRLCKDVITVAADYIISMEEFFQDFDSLRMGIGARVETGIGIKDCSQIEKCNVLFLALVSR